MQVSTRVCSEGHFCVSKLEGSGHHLISAAVPRSTYVRDNVDDGYLSSRVSRQRFSRLDLMQRQYMGS